MNKYKYSFDLGAFFGSEEKETRLKEAPAVETSILPRPNKKQEAVQESEPEYDPYGFIPDFAAAYEGAGGMPSVGSDLPLPVGPDRARQEVIDSVLNDLQKASATPQPDLTQATPSVSSQETTYEVKSGDTLTKVAKEYGVAVDDIVEANGLADANVLDIGQSLVIPSAGQVEETTTEEAAPVTTEEVATTEVTTGGTGLMSRKVAADTAVSSVTDLVYSDFVEAGQEGDEAHVGQDSKNITLAGGVVPDGLIYDGKDFKQNKATVSGFDKAKLDTSKAYKVVGGKKVKRSDFKSDKDFAKGVIKAFEDQAKDAAGSSWDSMSDGSKKAVVKIGWNKGENWYKGSSAKSIYKELAKETPNPANLYSKILVGSTVKGGGASIGIAKARANAWNETISATGGKEITKIEADNSGTNTALKYYDAEGNLLHTEQTSRASSKYENKATSISKDSNGVW